VTEDSVAGRYDIAREIGRGASATVYRAHDRTLDRDIAIKIVAPALANDPSFVDRFMREARLAGGLSHPNIVTVHDVGETADGRPFLTMPLVSGSSLESVIHASAPLPMSEVSRILAELASALDYLHGQGLIHRDVKPSNVLIEESGRVLLSDFGVAYAREAARYTMTGMLLGTPRYMAPEQMLGEEPTPATDVYAMGVLAFEMLAGAPPFQGTGTGLMYRIVHEPPPPVSSITPGIPPGVESAIARALQKDRADRWASPGEFAAAVASPGANATMAGPRPNVVPPVAVAAPPGGEEPAETPDASSPLAPAPAPGDFGSRGMPTKAILGLGSAAIIGLAVAGYCLGSAGTGPLSSAADDEPTPSPTPRPAATATPTTPPPPTTAPTLTTTPTHSPTPSPTPTPAPPNAPSNVVLNGNTLSWSDDSSDESGFRIYWRSTNLSTGQTNVVNDKSVGPNVTSTSVSTIFLTADQTGFRRGVAAYNATGESVIAGSQ
jgi:serine/threonine-protein kinase